MATPKKLTLRDILVHVQGMERRLTKGIDRVDAKVDRLEKRIDRMESNLTAQIDAIDNRLDVLEIEQLPKRVKHLEKLAGIAA